MDKYDSERKQLKRAKRRELKDFHFLFDFCFKIYFEIINILNLIQIAVIGVVFARIFKVVNLILYHKIEVQSNAEFCQPIVPVP